MQLEINYLKETIQALKDNKVLENSLQEKDKIIMSLEERIEKLNADKKDYDRIIRSQEEEIVQPIEDNKGIKESLINSEEKSIKKSTNIQDIKDESNIVPNEGDEERLSKRSREGVKIGTEEERLEMIEHFLQLGYEMTSILNYEKTCGSDKECIINYIRTGSRN